ncbi:MAG TPA: methyltransferase domain-containing protein [Nitrolancea sp.]|jgi:predicted nicotinamide N-methyase|nr:methyltransferase domain-containing protein [Nitrolancea sp.]
MPDRAASLHAELLQRIGLCADASLTLPGSGVKLQLVKPTDFDALLEAATGDPEQNLPYWAEIWPSGIALADEILAQPETVRGIRVLELGSGLGVTATAAQMAGADLTIADYSSESLLLCRYNALINTEREPNALQVNWRDPSAALRALAGSGFPVLLAADVLYESRDVDPLLDLIDWLVAPDGLLWLAEPGRNVASLFMERALELGWHDVESFHAGPWPDPRDFNVAVTVHQLRRDSLG